MFCQNCNAQLPNDATFCANCGAPVQQQAPQYSTPFTPAAIGKKMSIYDILVIAALALMVIGTLLPCYTIKLFGYSTSVSYIQGDGIFIIIAAVASFVLYYRLKDKAMAISSGIAAIILLLYTFNASDVGIGSFGIGFYIMWIGTIASIALPFTPFAVERILFKK